MPSSTTDTTRATDTPPIARASRLPRHTHTPHTPHTVHTTTTGSTGISRHTAASVLTTIAKPFHQTARLVETYTSTSQYERHLCAEEETLVTRIHDYLSPTVLHPLQGFRRPWARQDPTGVAPKGQISQYTEDQDRLEKSLASFIETLPALLSFEIATDASQVEGDLITSLDLRIAGHPYDAASLLKRLTGDNTASAIVQVHYSDTLRLLGIHNSAHHLRVDQSTLWSDDGSKISYAAQMFAYSNRTLERLPMPPSLLEAVSAEVAGKMFRPPAADATWHDMYATICYCHSFITIRRFTLAIEDSPPVSQSSSSTEALDCLIQVWRVLDGPLQIDQRGFLRWRCGQALNDCLPFSDPTLHLPDKEDVFSTLISAGSVNSSQLLPVLRRWWTGETVDSQDCSILVTHLEGLFRLHDVRGVSELLHAIQLIPNPELTALRAALRPHQWRLHREMLPLAAWVLDDGLLNALYLWVVDGEKTGALAVCHTDGQHTGETREGELAGGTTCISRLQFGLGALSRDDEASKRWIFSWSILYRCLQYVPGGLKNEIYPLLFVDSDLFSWSQLCRHLRCLCRLQRPNDSQHDLILDGIDDPHGDLAGLGHLSKAAKGQEMITQLTRKINGLHRLQGELQRIAPTRDQEGPQISRCEGLDSLAGLCMIWKGFARLARANEMSDVQKASAMPLTMNAYASYSSSAPFRLRPHTQQIKADLEEARKDFQRAFELGRRVKLGWLVLQGGNGLLSVHDPLFDLDQQNDGSSQNLVKAAARLALCETLKDEMRFSIVQGLGPPLYMFVFDSRIAVTTTSQHKLVQLYQAAQQSLHTLGKYKEATSWLQEEADHTSLGHQMSLMNTADDARHIESGDAPVPMETTHVRAKRR